MSVYKVIGNYYEDLLDFLRSEDLKNNGLGNMFNSITDDKKRIVVSKLSDMMVRFDMAFQRQVFYWKSKMKSQVWYIVIFVIIMLLSILLVVSWLKYIRFPEMRDRGESSNTMALSVISHIVVCEVVVSLFFVLIVNTSWIIKLCKGQIRLLEEELIAYTNLIFAECMNEHMPEFFMLLGYSKKFARNPSDEDSAGRIGELNALLVTSPVYTPLISLFYSKESAKPNDKNEEDADKQQSKQTIGTVNMSKSVDVNVYNTLRGDIEKSLTSFYDNGGGDLKVKKRLLQSSPILMLKETKNIIRYYEILGYKSIAPESMEASDKKGKEIISEIVIPPLLELVSFSESLKIQAKEETLPSQASSVQETDEMIIADEAFLYTAAFLYQFYIGKNASDDTFPAEIGTKMPSEIPDPTDTSVLSKGKAKIKAFYTNLTSDEQISTMIKARLVLPGGQEQRVASMKEFCKYVQKLFADCFYNVVMTYKGSVFYYLNKQFLQQRISSKLSQVFDQAYRDVVIPVLLDDIVLPLSQSMDIISIRSSSTVDSCASKLVPTKLDVLTYQNYIIESMMRTNSSSQNYVDQIVDILDQMSRSVNIRRQTIMSDKLLNENKYNDVKDFSELIKTITFKDMNEELRISYFSEIVTQFYRDINESVQGEVNNLRDLYFSRRKATQVWRIVIVMLIIILVTVYIRFAFGTLMERKYIRYVAPNRDCDIMYAKADYQSRQANFWIKLLLPLFIIMFIISMLIAFQKKMEGTFTFNKDIISSNTNNLKKTLVEFSEFMNDLNNRLEPSKRLLKIQSVPEITTDDKKQILEYIKKVLDDFERCNYILESAKSKIPFPYADVVVNGFMLTVTFLALMYVLFVMAPIKRLQDIKVLNKMKERLMVTEDLVGFDNELDSFGVCHNEEMDSIVFSLKLIFFTFIIMFLIFYSVKITESANGFQSGLYNSMYFENSICYDN